MADRKRARGFALMDASFAADAKFLRLSRRAASPSKFAAAVGVFWLILADCRRGSSPEVSWADYEEYAEEIALLKDAGLLLPNGFAQPTFDRWAPAYKSPWDVRRGTQGNAGVQKDTEHHLISTQVPNGVGGVGEGGTPQVFMGFRPKDPEGGAGLWHGQGLHDGRHGTTCAVCHPELLKP